MDFKNKIAEDIFKEQLRILECCGKYNDGTIEMSSKYFMEMLVRPYFGDDNEKYEQICKIFDKIE